MSISKTQAIGWIVMVLGFGGVIGVDFPIEAIEAGLNIVADNTTEVLMLIWGAVQVWLRKITDSPAVQGLLGLLFKED